MVYGVMMVVMPYGKYVILKSRENCICIVKFVNISFEMICIMLNDEYI